MKHCDPKILLSKANIRPTTKKTALLAEMMDCDSPVSARELHASLSRTITIDLVTVYRTLTALHTAGIVREVVDNPDGRYYELACVHNPIHAHFKCSRCLKILCLDTFGQVERGFLADLADGCEVREISITLTGLCPECRSGETS